MSDDQGRGFAVNETGEQCSPLHIFVRITENFVKKSEMVKCQKGGMSDFCKTKSLMSGTSRAPSPT